MAMKRYKLMHAVANINGKETLISVRDFFLTQLEGDELQEFLADKAVVDAYNDQAETDGFLERGGIVDTVQTDEGWSEVVEVGEYNNRDEDQSPVHPLVWKYFDKFKNDPRVIKFDGFQPITE